MMTDRPSDQKVCTFILEEDGAVTVDWVVLTAAVIGIAMLFIYPVVTSTTSATKKVGQYVGSTKVTISASN